MEEGGVEERRVEEVERVEVSLVLDTTLMYAVLIGWLL